MYVAKRCGGNRAKLFEPSLYDLAARQFELDQDLREALSGGDQFTLVYQPMFRIGRRDPAPGRLRGAAALAAPAAGVDGARAVHPAGRDSRG